MSRTEQPRELRIYVGVRGRSHRLHLSGELAGATAPRLEQVVERRVAEADEIVIHLQEVMFIDSMGLRAILACKELCRRHSCTFALTQGSANVQRAFETSGLLERLPFIEG